MSQLSLKLGSTLEQTSHGEARVIPEPEKLPERPPVQDEMCTGHKVLLLDESVQDLGVLVQRHWIHILGGQESIQELDVVNMFLPTKDVNSVSGFVEISIPREGEAIEDDVFVQVDDPDDDLTCVVLKDGGGKLGPDLLQVPHPVLLEKLWFGQLTVVDIWMLKFGFLCDSHIVSSSLVS